MGIQNQIENLRERIEMDNIADRDKDVLRQFDERLTLLAQQYSDHRHKKLLRHTVIMAEQLENGLLADCLVDADATDDILSWINRTYENEETNRDYRSALRVFANRVTDGDEIPDSVEHVPTSTSRTYDTTPNPRDMLRWDDDVKPMIDACNNARGKAMIALQFDAGLRGGEFKSLTVGDIQDHKNGLELTVEGKQGRRTLLLIPSVPWVSRWLEVHPDRSERDAPLWSKLTKCEGISDRMVYNIFEAAAEDADVKRPVTLTNFRKSSAAFLASRNLNQAHIEDHHGWVRGSDAAARYIAVFGKDTDRELARLHGIDIPEDDEVDEIGPVDCITCGRSNDREASFCDNCGQALDPESAADIEKTKEDVRAVLAELTPEQAEAVLDVADLLETKDVRESLTGDRHQ